MTTIFPANMTKPTVISTNRARHKPTKPPRQQAKRSHHSPNEATGSPNINAWTKRKQPTLKLDALVEDNEEPLFQGTTSPTRQQAIAVSLRRPFNQNTSGIGPMSTILSTNNRCRNSNPFRIPKTRWPGQKMPSPELHEPACASWDKHQQTIPEDQEQYLLYHHDGPQLEKWQ